MPSRSVWFYRTCCLRNENKKSLFLPVAGTVKRLLCQRLAAALEGLKLRRAARGVFEAPALEASLDLAGEAFGVALRLGSRRRGSRRRWLERGESGRGGRRRPEGVEGKKKEKTRRLPNPHLAPNVSDSVSTAS